MNTLPLLMKREYWEHRGGFLWTPVWTCAVILVVTLAGIVTAEILGQRADVHIGISLSALHADMSAQDVIAAGNALDLAQVMFGFVTCIALFFVLFFYLLGALYDDRRDRSVLFWKSLPVTDTATVAAKALCAAFLAPLIGSLVRALWGPLCDRFGGAIWTFVGGVGMVVSAAVAAVYLSPRSPADFWPFLTAMLVMFFFTGMANAGTFKQMPMILPPRQAGGVIGWTAAIASFGPFFVGVALTAVTPKSFFVGATVYFAICTTLVWLNYARPRAPYPG